MLIQDGQIGSQPFCSSLLSMVLLRCRHLVSVPCFMGHSILGMEMQETVCYL